ncbi:MAG: metallophosphoesterase [Lachnospiraceae bacterium]|nr:metallophosphoesterase [Lachnospiraceae bacterium]
MKLIHTADIHLDSKLSRHLDDARAAERKNELLSTFQNIVHYAVSNSVDAILIAGDLFDIRNISATARDAVISVILNNPNITFFYLRGNHDAGAFLDAFKNRIQSDLPENLKLFKETWTSYHFTGQDGTEVVITGAEINRDNNTALESSLALNQAECNIVMLHGQETETKEKNDAEIIPIRNYRNRGIDYLALGHIHQPKIAQLDARGTYSYCGCPEGRGFDEIGPRGFNLLTVKDGTVDVRFVPFAQRIIYDMKVDVSNALTNDDAVGLIRSAFEEGGVLFKDLAKVRLSGETGLDVHFDIAYIAHVLNENYYLIRVKDESRPAVVYDSFIADMSLKGEFVRMVKDAVDREQIDEEDAGKIIALGIRLLSGEEKLS